MGEAGYGGGLFTEAIFEDHPVRLFNHGRMRRDFAYIDDVIEAVVRLIKSPSVATPAAAVTPQPPYRIYNVGNGQPVEVVELLDTL
jgi:UDP-glucuronate 4-epimerase